MTASSDLARALAGHQAPTGAGFRYGQGKLVHWNPATFENTIAWNGTTLQNRPVLAGPAALTFAPGQTVALAIWAPAGGAASVAILGSWVTPGTTAAVDQVAFMTSALAKSVSNAVFAEQVHSAEVTGGAILADETSFTDLPGSPGPAVAGVEVTSGVAIAFISCEITVNLPNGSGSAGADVGVAVSGATTVAPNTVDALTMISTQINAGGSTAPDRADRIRGTAAVKLDGLNPGAHDFELKYRNTGATGSATFQERNLTVLAL